ncbi:turripeptide Ici9.2 [Anabrus simplex]|uniref:turripeptide Ici9.2 n=1 Tax=Anabrus simplex TaxID=316456 RepID=UPI0035A309A3
MSSRLSFTVFLLCLLCCTLMKEARTGSCRKRCQHICPAIYEPICAGSCNHPIRTFNNKCELSRYNCVNNLHLKALRKGPCGKC